jgi:uncharacterized FAD-dependent dehydrogenase
MSSTVQFQLTPEKVHDNEFLRQRIRQELELNNDDFTFKWKRRSIDARKRQILYNATFEVYLDGESPINEIAFIEKDVHHAKEVVIIGAGPAGLFAALRCIENGLKPIVYERGKDVRER